MEAALPPVLGDWGQVCGPDLESPVLLCSRSLWTFSRPVGLGAGVAALRGQSGSRPVSAGRDVGRVGSGPRVGGPWGRPAPSHSLSAGFGKRAGSQVLCAQRTARRERMRGARRPCLELGETESRPAVKGRVKKKKIFFFETRDVQTEWKGLLRPVLARLTQVMSPECPSGFRCDVLEFRYQ